MAVRILEPIPDVASITLMLNTRSREGPWLSKRITSWVKDPWDMEYRRGFDKRIDTTLIWSLRRTSASVESRTCGHVGGCDGGLSQCGPRTTRDGRQYLHGSPPASVLREVGTDDLGQYLVPSSAPLKLVSREALYRDVDTILVDRLRVRRVCFDASSDEDLRQIGVVPHRLRGITPILWSR